MGYFSYSLEQLLDSCGRYQEICNLFFGLASNEEIKSKLVDVLYNGTCDSFVFSSNIVNKDNPNVEVIRRISMAYLLVKNPDTFDFFVQNKINLFHGTNANALPSILKYGLNSAYESEKNGIYVLTGEKFTRMYNTRNFVSFTDVLGIACDYSTLLPEVEKNNLSFEVVVGTTVGDVIKAGKCNVISDVSEVGVKNKLPLENIKVICVPSSKKAFVKKLVGDKGIAVLSLDGINDRFFYADDIGFINIDYTLYNKLKKDLRKSNKDKIFKLEDMKKLMVEWLLEKINNKNYIKDGERGYDGKRGR